jgi:hypothetical protein
MNVEPRYSGIHRVHWIHFLVDQARVPDIKDCGMRAPPVGGRQGVVPAGPKVTVWNGLAAPPTRADLCAQLTTHLNTPRARFYFIGRGAPSGAWPSLEWEM